VALVGLSGSGKSSLIRLMFRLCEVDRGVIAIDGVPISALLLSLQRNQIAIVPQDTSLFDTYNIGIGAGKRRAGDRGGGEGGGEGGAPARLHYEPVALGPVDI